MWGKRRVIQWQLPIYLASASPRRGELLAEAGIESFSFPPDCDDGVFTCGTMPVNRWVQSLSVLKIQNVLQRLVEPKGTALAADTVCVVDDKILGQPKTKNAARGMLQSMVNRSHMVFTGWCLSSVDQQHFLSGCEQSEITIGFIDGEEIEKYLCTSNWKGKAGAYNLSERVAAGWPITCDGDPTTVMGLPMNRLTQEIFRKTN